jgi:hypothetical protein
MKMREWKDFFESSTVTKSTKMINTLEEAFLREEIKLVQVILLSQAQ